MVNQIRDGMPILEEGRFRSLAQVSEEIVWTSAPDGEQKKDAPEWEAFTGQRREEVAGFGWADAIHPEDRDLTIRRWTESVATGKTFEVEHRLRRRDGAYRNMLARGVPLRDASGKIVEWVGVHSDITERKLLEEALRQRERDLTEAHRLARLGTWHWTLADDEVTWSEEVYRVFGFDPALPPPGYEALALLHEPDSRTRLHAAVQRTLESGEPYALDVEILLEDGTNKWITARGEVEEWIDGRPGKLRGTIQEITERKLAEQALRKSENRFRRLYESNLIGIGFPDKWGNINDGNDELLRIVGYSREDLHAGLVRWDRMTPPEYRELDQIHILEARERGSCTPYEKEYIRKDGCRVPILCGFARLEGSDSESIGFVLDFSAQKTAEAALRESEKQFRALAESLPQLVWVTDSRGANTYCNRRMVDYTGLPMVDLMGLSWERLFHPEDLAPTVETWQRCLATGEPYQSEYRLRRHDGVYRHFLARAVPVRNDRGEIDHWIGSSTDIHEQRLAEEALRRTEKLDAAARFAASMAHEINNPLASVTNILYLALQDRTLSPETREYLSMADRELARAAQVVTRTLRFHRQSTSAVLADLGDVMDSALTLFASRFASCAIPVEREYRTREKLYCYGDEVRQVFTNLLSNALDATPHGGRVQIRVRSCSATGRPGIRVVVADTGYGIPTSLRKQIFEPFVSTKVDTGTGLGLWVSEGIVRKHKGRIAVRSRTGQEVHGTVFSLFFPYDGLASGVSPREPNALQAQAADIAKR
jgi:PAS domain S-box-containing protein